MSMFTHADTCRCGGCQPAPPDGAYPEGPPGEPPAREAELSDDDVYTPEYLAQRRAELVDTDRAQVCDCPDPCGCYADGYADGKDKAHFEVRMMTADGGGHAAGCGCEPCLTLTAVTAALTAALVDSAARAALGGCGLTGGTLCGTLPDGRVCPGRGEGVTGAPADGCPTAPRGGDLDGLAAGVLEAVARLDGYRAIVDAHGIASAARLRWAEHALARLDGRADVFGLDPDARRDSWAGRYDGSL